MPRDSAALLSASTIRCTCVRWMLSATIRQSSCGSTVSAADWIAP